jgi:hypothetical protein
VTRALQSLPTASTTGRAATLAIARQMLRVIGAGWQAPQGSLTAADALAFGASLDDARLMLIDLLNQAFANSVTSMVGEWEAAYGLLPDASLTLAERQTRLLAFIRSSGAGTPQSIASAIDGFTGGGTSVVETPSTTVDPRAVFRFVVVVPLAILLNAAKRARIADMIERMKPAHTIGVTANAVGFYCDGYLGSVVDYTVLGS